jgi:hypothetical protein
LVNFLAEETLAVVVLTTSPIACVGTDKKKPGAVNATSCFDSMDVKQPLSLLHFISLQSFLRIDQQDSIMHTNQCN